MPDPQLPDPGELATLNLRLPPFWSNCPEAWFLVIESQFNNRRITNDATKYNYVVSALPAEVSTSVLDVLRKPPDTDKYAALKTKLIARHSISEEKKLEELLSASEQGDRKPSVFYRDMESLATAQTGVNSELLFKLWLRKLVPAIRVAITASTKTALDDILDLADKIWEVSSPQIHAATVATTSSSCNLPPAVIEALSTLSVNMNNLQREVSELKRQSVERFAPREHTDNVCSSCRGRSRSRAHRNHSRSSSRSHNNSSGKPLCWYHFTFGANAQKCTSPCTFTATSHTPTTNENLN